MAERYKKLLRPDLILIILVIAAGFGIYYLGQEIGGTPEEEKELERQIVRRKTTLDDLAAEVAELETRVTDLEALPFPQPYLSREEATNLGPAISAYVSDNGLKLLNFNTSRQEIPINEDELRPVISYLIIAQGDAPALVGLLKLVDAVDTAVVQSLEFTRDLPLQPPEGEAPAPVDQNMPIDWILNLSMVVHYSLE
jgi:hypothetical protein